MAVVQYFNQRATRNDPLDPNLVALYEQAAAAAGIDIIRVVSGGQEAAGEGGKRTGSTRHDHGGAGDIQLVKNGRVLDSNDANDLQFIKSFISHASGLGATGIGAGTSYMGSRTFHVGFGPRATWGGVPKDGRPAPPPPAWLLEAVGAPVGAAAFRQGGGPPGSGQMPRPAGIMPNLRPGGIVGALASAIPTPQARPEGHGAVDGFKPPNFDPRGGGSKHAYAPFDEETGTGMYRTSGGNVLRFNRAGQTIYGGAKLQAPRGPRDQGGPPAPNARPARVRAADIPPLPKPRPRTAPPEARMKDDAYTPRANFESPADIGRGASNFRSFMLKGGNKPDENLDRLVNTYFRARTIYPFQQSGGPIGGLMTKIFGR